MDEQFASAVNAHKAYWNELKARIETLRHYAKQYPLTLHEMKVDRMAATNNPKVVKELADYLFDNCLRYMKETEDTIGVQMARPRNEINDLLAAMVQLNLILTILEG